VYLISLKDPRAAERVLTENVSSHGARVITKQRCQPGEQQQITPLSGEFQLLARVVYCQPLPHKGFCVGLEFRECSVNWGDDLFK
jgi:PilZ domain